MKELFDLAYIQTLGQKLLESTATVVQAPLFWLQFAIIAVVFVLARWLLTPSGWPNPAPAYPVSGDRYWP